MVSLLNEFVCVLLTHIFGENTFHIHCTCVCRYEYSYAASNTSQSKNISDTQYMNTLCPQHGCYFLHLNDIDLHIVRHTLYEQAIGLSAFCSAGVYWYQFLTVLCCNFHLHITPVLLQMSEFFEVSYIQRCLNWIIIQSVSQSTIFVIVTLSNQCCKSSEVLTKKRNTGTKKVCT